MTTETYRLLVLHRDGNIVEETLGTEGSEAGLRASQLVQEPGIDAVRIYCGKTQIATMERPQPLSENAIERRVEHRMDALDRRYTGEGSSMSEVDYLAACKEIDDWAEARYAERRKGYVGA